MAVIVSNGPTTLSTVNGFYATDAVNVGPYNGKPTSASSNYGLVLSTTRTVALTFAANDTCLGVIICLNTNYNNPLKTSTDFNKNVTVVLQENVATVWTDRVSKTLTPEEIFHDVTYRSGWKFVNFSFGAGYAVTTAASTWRLSISQGAGTGDWYLTCSDAGTNAFRIPYMATTATAASKYFRGATMTAATDKVNATAHPFVDTDRITFVGDPTVSTMATGLAVNTWYYVVNAGVNDFEVSLTSGGAKINITADSTGSWNVACPVDTIICKDKVTIDKDFCFKGVTGTSYTTFGVCAIMCDSPSTSADPNNWGMLEWDSTPSGSFDIVVDGGIVCDGHATFMMGSSASRIPYAQKGIIWELQTNSFGGTAGYSGIMKGTVDGYVGSQGGGFGLYGEIPANGGHAVLAADLNTGSASCTVVDNTGWAIGDKFMISKSKTALTTFDSTVYTVNGTSGTDTISFTPNVATHNRQSGGELIPIVNNGYGIEVRSNTTTVSYWSMLDWPAMRTSSGVFWYYMVFHRGFGSTAYPYQETGSSQQAKFNDNGGRFVYVSLSGSDTIQDKGFEIARNRIAQGGTTPIFLSAFQKATPNIGNGTQPQWASGTLSIHDNTIFGGYVNQTTIALNLPYQIYSNKWHNVGAGVVVGGANVEYYSNETFGQTSSSYGAVMPYAVKSSRAWHDNTYDYCAVCIRLDTSASCLNTSMVNDSFGAVGANTVDISVGLENFSQIVIDTPTTAAPLVISGNILLTIPGFSIGIQNETASNVDRTIRTHEVITRTGDGLGDTTVHTAGSNKFALKINSSDTIEQADWGFNVPTGNILGMDMVVAVWCKINHANYYAGTHQLPRLEINYDNGTIAYCQAAESTNWQILLVPFTPTTSYGLITVTLQTQTDETGTDADVYFDDFSVLYPAGYVLNLGGLDLWANALPITPPISTSIAALDVWAADPSTFGAGTIGAQVKKALTTGKFLALK